MSKLIQVVFLMFVCNVAFSQNNITGNFPSLANQYVKLVRNEGFSSYLVDSVRADDKGVFIISFHRNDYGVGLLITENNKPFIVILCKEDIQLKGESFASPEAIKILKGHQNQIFEQYAVEHSKREEVLSAWGFLNDMYDQDSLFRSQAALKKIIAQEARRIQAEESLVLAELDSTSYVGWYLPVRKLVRSVPVIAQFRVDEIESTLSSFRKLDYSNPFLYRSGLLKDVVDSHFWLITNSHQSLEAVQKEMEISIDSMILNLVSDEQKLNEITGYLFKLLERQRLISASEYLAVKLLNEKRCTLNNNLANQLESYRAMSVGNTAQDFLFKGELFTPGYSAENKPNKLSDIKSKYVVLIFGASWCPACPPELLEVVKYYEKWKSKDIEVVFVSLDESKSKFKSFAGIFPFISLCDFKKWNSSIVNAYHVFATPTVYLLDGSQKIILRPDSVRQIDEWVDKTLNF